MKTTTYSPKPALSNPSEFFRDGGNDLKNAWELSIALARRDLSALYRQSALGYVWAFLPILATTGVFLFLRSGGAFQTSDAGMPYPVYLLVGSLLWQVFTDAVNGPLKVVSNSKNMIVKINFPREALIVAGMLITFFNLGIRSIILIPALIFFHYKGIYTFDPSTIHLFPFGVLALILLGYMIGLLLTPIGMLYKDVSMALTMILGFWMFISPVVVTIPEFGFLSSIMQWNPASCYIDVTRAWLLGASPTLLTQFLIYTPISLIFIFLGWILYRVALPHVIARLGM